MKTRVKVTLICGLLLFLSGTIYPQTPSASTTRCTGFPLLPPPPPSLVPIIGAPYSAVNEVYGTRSVHGSQSETHTQIQFYRDSTGRVRWETSTCESSDGSKAIEIRDPSSGFLYLLDTQKHIAHRWPLPTVTLNAHFNDTPRPPAKTDPDKLDDLKNELRKPQLTREPLGTQTIEGVTANGTKVTETFPSDPQTPRERVCEQWFSPELHTMVVSKRFVVGSGLANSSFYVTHINRNEPEPALFQVPPGFTMVDHSQESLTDWTTFVVNL